VSRFTGGACGHKGKLIVLIVLLPWGPAHSLIPWCSAFSVLIRGKPATQPLKQGYIVTEGIIYHVPPMIGLRMARRRTALDNRGFILKERNVDKRNMSKEGKQK
jgi:hypothetical protein